ncbi:hypothetical protein I3843_09G088900 [Carya illinoinensis]|uniref:Uncharacterized protein n=1 Tax=Carya illinoinensis TaxID=32201 RepID=A0A922E3N4_CARIL|nr:hypothetical protein I3760_09G087900 [Carya illinoinensis]KAG6695261.1 hypothetical protein I3842_09G088300 [Carya illinoinensis]KAG7962877.1 hypothetical protein I3843_09G088900 [Carya illinoinensis]
MGNCCRRESRSMVWAGDDWGSLTSKIDEEADHNQNTYNVERLRLLGENGAFALSNSSSTSNGTTTGAATREVRVKITKKELEELVGRVDVRGLSAKQVLDQLMDAADHGYDEAEHDHRSWRPALQSIPEVN